MNPQFWQVVAGIVVACGALYAVVTAPLLRLIKAESNLTEGRIKLLKTELTAEISTSEARLRADMTAMETRLNERIDTRLVHNR